jgi:hypothetical protein
MSKGIVLGVLVLGASLMSSPALAKKNPCTKATGCPAQITSEFKTCKGACAKKDKACKRECSMEKKAQKKACKMATNPTPPSCGFTDEESPSGAFLDVTE